jgi:hypothetical protein
VTNNTTRVRIGYRIYSLWRFTAAHIIPTVGCYAINTGRPTVGCYATNSTGVVSVSMEIFKYDCLVTAALSQTRHNIFLLCTKHTRSLKLIKRVSFLADIVWLFNLLSNLHLCIKIFGRMNGSREERTCSSDLTGIQSTVALVRNCRSTTRTSVL